MKIYHNPRCSKSRQTLNIIKEKGAEVEIIEYLNAIPSEKELRDLITLLGIKPEELLRKGEADYKENFKGKTLSGREWISAMIKYPKIIERPIVVSENKAILGRPPENVLDLL
jgi:arsenate reductase